MEVIFDIDGTVSSQAHRLHFIKDTNYFFSKDGGPLKPDWGTFLSDEQVSQDTPIKQTWALMNAMLDHGHTIIFITARHEGSRAVTWKWLTDESCPIRYYAARFLKKYGECRLYMRTQGDRRDSHVVKEESLHRAISDGFAPTMVFEDRTSDAQMWRRNGLLCCQVADGDF